MVDLATGGALEAAAWKVKNLEDYDARLERAVRRVDELAKAHKTAALVIYEAALMKSGRSVDEVRGLVRRFEQTFENEEEKLTIPRLSGIMNVEGDEWFFGNGELRAMTGKLLGQFQHRVTQYNYLDEHEVLRRWADSYDTRLFIRRRVYETEPIVGVVAGFDFPLIQYLRVAAGGDTLVPSEKISRTLAALGILAEEAAGDDYAVLATAEGLALRLELPAPVVGEILYDLALEDSLEFPKRPPGATEAEAGQDVPSDLPVGDAEQPPTLSRKDREARRAARHSAARGEEPSRVQDPQAKDTPGVLEEGDGENPTPASPEARPPEGAPGTSDEGS
jgi:hypothetical protein